MSLSYSDGVLDNINNVKYINEKMKTKINTNKNKNKNHENVKKSLQHIHHTQCEEMREYQIDMILNELLMNKFQRNNCVTYFLKIALLHEVLTLKDATMLSNMLIEENEKLK